MKKKFDYLFYLLGLAIVLVVWAILSANEKLGIVFPDPVTTFRSFLSLWTTDGFFKILANTFVRSLCAFCLSVVFALCFSLLATVFPPFGKVISPFVSVFSATPTMAVVLFLLIWLNSFVAPVLVAFLIVFPVLYSSFSQRLAEVKCNVQPLAKVFKLQKSHLVCKVYLKELLPTLFVQSSSSFALAVKVVISGEVISYTANSIGLSMQSAKAFLQVDLLLAWTIVAVLLSVFCDLLVKLIYRIFRRCELCR